MKFFELVLFHLDKLILAASVTELFCCLDGKDAVSRLDSLDEMRLSGIGAGALR